MEQKEGARQAARSPAWPLGCVAGDSPPRLPVLHGPDLLSPAGPWLWVLWSLVYWKGTLLAGAGRGHRAPRAPHFHSPSVSLLVLASLLGSPSLVSRGNKLIGGSSAQGVCAILKGREEGASVPSSPRVGRVATVSLPHFTPISPVLAANPRPHLCWEMVAPNCLDADAEGPGTLAC